MEKYKIEIAKEFNDKLGGRWKKLGPFSGEQFYETLLKDKFQEALAQNEKLFIYLDGTKGYGSSFLDQSFGELAREFGVEIVSNIIVFKTEYFDWYAKYVKKEIWGIKL